MKALLGIARFTGVRLRCVVFSSRTERRFPVHRGSLDTPTGSNPRQSGLSRFRGPVHTRADAFTTGSNESDRDNNIVSNGSSVRTRFQTLFREIGTHSDNSNSRSEEDLAASLWREADAILRVALRDLQRLRSREERGGEPGRVVSPERAAAIRECLGCFDRLAEFLPRAEDHASTWLSSRDPSPWAPSEAASAECVLETDLLNEFLREWMVAWKVPVRWPNKRQRRNQPLLPKPSVVAERIDDYRSRYLVQADSASYGLLLGAMMHPGSKNGGIPHRLQSVKLADDYLRRLWKAQRHGSPGSFVDTVSITNVIKAWVDLGQPQKAQELLDRMEDENANHPSSPGDLRPNAVTYATVIHGWAKRGDALRAESVLQRAIAAGIPDGGHEADDGMASATVDRVVFHTVLDAWATRASSRHNPRNTDQGLGGSDGCQRVIPAVRAKELVETMDGLANQHPLLLGHLRPTDETWHKLIAVVAVSSPTTSKNRKNQKSAKDVREEIGPRAAEQLLVDFEDRSSQSSSISTTPVVLLNQILHAYCSSSSMEEAEAFYHRRCRLIENQGMQSESNLSNNSTFPNDVTFHTILAGWANAAKVAGKKKKKKSTKNIKHIATAEIPLYAETWLDKMEEWLEPDQYPSTRAYGSVLQAWSLSTRYHEDAADRAEDLLRQRVWPLAVRSEDDAIDDDWNLSRSHELAKDLEPGIVICTNIALRAWSNQTATAATLRTNHSNNDNGRSVGKCLRLLNDFFELAENSTLLQIKPTEETFRAVLHAIVTPRNGMSPVQKHDHAKALLSSMRDTWNLRPSNKDIEKFERLRSRKDGHAERERR